MHLLTYVNWAVEPEIFSIGAIHVRWYGVLFASGFLLGYLMLYKIFLNEKESPENAEKLLIYMMVSVIVGARLGHVIFYDWDYYSENLGEIVMIWKGGLASHGATIAILIALWIYSKRVIKKPMLWILDRATGGVAIGAAFVRLGNLMNHEIVGKVTDVSWAFKFSRIDNLPRHPVQLYEFISYVLICVLMNFMYWKTSAKDKPGLMFGTLLITLFGARFFIEIFKRSQGGFEVFLGNVLSTGQWLSIPLILIGVFFIVRALKKPDQTSSIQ